MKRTNSLRSFLIGALTATLAFALVLPAGAALAGKTIQVFTGVDLYVDDVKLQPKDASGNPVEVFVYNGTTYLPVRAVGQAVDMVVQWDAKSNSVYLGKHTGEKPAVWLKDLDYFMGDDWLGKTSVMGNTGVTYSNAIYPNGGLDNTYLINGQYSKLTGTFFQKYEYRTDSRESTLKIFGDGELIYEASVASGVKPLDFSVDLTGVLELCIEYSCSVYNGSLSALADCGLWTE